MLAAAGALFDPHAPLVDGFDADEVALLPHPLLRVLEEDLLELNDDLLLLLLKPPLGGLASQ